MRARARDRKQQQQQRRQQLTQSDAGRARNHEHTLALSLSPARSSLLWIAHAHVNARRHSRTHHHPLRGRSFSPQSSSLFSQVPAVEPVGAPASRSTPCSATGERCPRPSTLNRWRSSRHDAVCWKHKTESRHTRERQPRAKHSLRSSRQEATAKRKILHTCILTERLEFVRRTVTVEAFFRLGLIFFFLPLIQK